MSSDADRPARDRIAYRAMTVDVALRVLQCVESTGHFGQMICHEMRELVGARSVGLFLPQGRRTQRSWSLIEVNPQRRRALLEDVPQWGCLDAVAHRSDLVLLDTGELDTQIAAQLKQHGVANCLPIPLQVQERCEGMLVLLDVPQDGGFSLVLECLHELRPTMATVLKTAKMFEDQEGVIQTRTQELAIHQQRLKSLASELSLAEERERRRIAAGVHDDIGQKLALAKLELQALQHTLEDTSAIKALERVCIVTDLIISDAHSLTFELSNPVLYEIGLDAAIESWLGANVKGKHGIEYRFHSDPRGIKPSEDVRVFLFQSVRELITNVLKHANASELEISTYRASDKLCVSVGDNGDGFDRARAKTKETGGFGLFSVEERLAYLGGRLEVDSQPGQGTTIVMVVPWQQESKLEIKG